MTNEQHTDTPPPAGPPPGGSTMRRFRRSPTDKVLTGVCGGLGEATNVDPVVYRVLLAVLTFFGGAGLLIYGACWLLMPEADKDTSLADQALAKGRDSGKRSGIVLVVVLTLAAIVATGAVSHDGRSVLLVALFALAVVLLTRRQGVHLFPRPYPGPFPGPGTPAQGTPPGTPPVPPTAPYFPPGAPFQPAGWSMDKPATEPVTEPYPANPQYFPPPAPKHPRERSKLGRLTFALALLGLGLLAAVDLGGADVDAAAYPALVLAVSGLGLVVGTFFGRARGLVALGIVAALALPPAAFADAFDGNWNGEDRLITPVDAAGIAPAYEWGAGRVRLDLSGVDFANADVHTTVDFGVGELEITVPANVDVETEADLGIGDATVFDVHGSGLGVSKEVTDTGLDGAGGGKLRLDLSQGIGRLEVRRATS